jgi:hypothetical protein
VQITFVVGFESGSRLSRIENHAFFEIGLIEIIVPASVKVLGDGAFVSKLGDCHLFSVSVLRKAE